MTGGADPADPPRGGRLVFVNRFFHPDRSATGQMLSDLALALAAAGRPVAVVTSRQRYDEPAADLPAREIVGGVHVHRVWASRLRRRGMAARALDDAAFCASAALALGRLLRRGDTLVAMTDPPLLPLLASAVAARRGAALVNWLQDLFPEIAEAAAPVPLARALRLLRGPRDRALRAAAMNVSIGRRMAAVVAARGVAAVRVRVIANWADGTAVRPVAPAENPLRRAWGLESRFVVGYSGNLGRAHDHETLLDAITRLEAAGCGRGGQGAAGGGHAGIAWLFVGGGAHLPRLRSEAVRAGWSSVQFRPYQPRERLAESLSAADLHIVSLAPRFEGLMLPSKYYGIAAAGRPAVFIGDPEGEIAELLARSGCGWTVRPGDGRALARCIMDLAQDPGRTREAGARARALFEQHFDFRHALAQWAALFEELAAGRR